MTRAIRLALALIIIAGSGVALATPAATMPVRVNSIVDVSDFQRPGVGDAEAIEDAIASAIPGDTVHFPAGVYLLYGSFHFRSGINYTGVEGKSVLRSGPSNGLVVDHEQTDALEDVTIDGLSFENIRLRLSGSEDETTIRDVTIKDCVFVNGAESHEWLDSYISLTYTENVTIDGCQFLRNQQSGGRGVVVQKTRATVITDSYFGTTRNLEEGAPNGHFRTAINIAGHDTSTKTGNTEVVVDGNVWRRTRHAPEPEGCIDCQDHGLYAWGSKYLFITGNRADGWNASPPGGSMKIRNQEDTFITDNRLRTSGILTYVYNSVARPYHLKRLLIEGNTFDWNTGGSDCASYCGINYWRNFSSPKKKLESDIIVRDNDFSAKSQIALFNGKGPAFCIEGNTGAQLSFAVDDVQTSDCPTSPSWDRPIAGLQRGDFNGDGVEDFVHSVHRDDDESEDGSQFWQAHLSDGDGFTTQDWGGGVYTSSLTSAYGAHVGDFNGDGLDDLTYYGYCGTSTRCWRMHLSTGSGFSEATSWGDHVWASGETGRYGVQVGDFNGDGRDDLVFRGYCDARVQCWRQLLSDGTTFTARNAGDGARWDGSATATQFGLKVGDFDGNGSDDIAYRGLCYPGPAACFRMHLATESGFQPVSWGDDANFAPVGLTAHFGMIAEDVNADGRTDLAYLGRCGSAPATQWRYHVSTGAGFVVRCSSKFESAASRG